MARQPLPVRLYNGAQRLIGAVRAPEPFVEAEASLREAARKATGLEDFGDDDYGAGLRVLLEAYDREARLTPFGRMMVRGELTGVLAARLLTEAGWKRDPGLLEHEIRRPIFILGLPRTGTTALHFLLGQDPSNQVLEYWLAGAPGPRPPREQWEADPRFVNALRALRLMYYLDPGLKAIHWMTADGPDECRHLFLQSFVDHTFDSNATIPSYTRWFAAQDMRAAYARHRDVLKLVGSPTPERRWVLKYPSHMRHLDILLETYPDACIVQTHRDPTRVLPSICSLVRGWRGLYEGPVAGVEIGSWQLEMYAGMMEKAMRVRDARPASHFFDLSFSELVHDPVTAIGRMYEHFGGALSADGEERLRAWHRDNPQGKHGGHAYRAEEFGISDDEIWQRFRSYTERFGVEPEKGRDN